MRTATCLTLPSPDLTTLTRLDELGFAVRTVTNQVRSYKLASTRSRRFEPQPRVVYLVQRA